MDVGCDMGNAIASGLSYRLGGILLGFRTRISRNVSHGFYHLLSG